MAHELDVSVEVKDAFLKWQTEVFYPKMNALMRASCDELEVVGIEQDKLIGVTITTIVAFGISSLITNFPHSEKDALLQDCSDIYDKVTKEGFLFKFQ